MRSSKEHDLKEHRQQETETLWDEPASRLPSQGMVSCSEPERPCWSAPCVCDRLSSWEESLHPLKSNPLRLTWSSQFSCVSANSSSPSLPYASLRYENAHSDKRLPNKTSFRFYTVNTRRNADYILLEFAKVLLCVSADLAYSSCWDLEVTHRQHTYRLLDLFPILSILV